MWNDSNEQHLRARGLAPLAPEIVTRYRTLADQPLLLLMLALYDADANGLQRSADGLPLDETGLYEELLRSFAVREVAKSAAGVPDSEAAAQVEQEMQRLSLVAFSMVNRRRQWVTEAELDLDLAALLGGRPAARTDFRGPLSQAGIAVGRFFFVQRSQAISADTRLQTFEFLHATFGEYLATRLAVQLAAGLLDRRPALTVGRSPADDDLLYALLSFAPLSSRQMLRFVAGRCLQAVAPAGRPQLATCLITVLDDSGRRTGHRHEDYAPAPLATARRHGIYCANLVLLILTLTGPLAGSQLFPGSPDPSGRWRGMTLLWRSALNEPDWTDLALALSIRRMWTGERRDLQISLTAEPSSLSGPVDLYWHYRYPPDDPRRGGARWSRAYWDEIDHKLDLSGGTNDAVLRHALEPVFRWLGPAVMAFQGIGDGPATSLAHDLLELCILPRAGKSGGELIALYRRLRWVWNPARWRTAGGDHAAALVLRVLLTDVARIPAMEVAEILVPASMNAAREQDLGVLALIPQVAAAALAVGAEDDGQRPARVVLAGTAVAAAIAVAAPGRRRDDFTPAELLTAVSHTTRLPVSVIEADYPDLIDAVQDREAAGGYDGASGVASV
jgi:hypothetical protein